MFKVWRDGSNSLGAKTVECIVSRSRGRHVVGLVDNQQIELAGIGRKHWSRVPHESHWDLALHPVHRGDEPWKRCPGIRMDAAGPTKLPEIARVDHPEFQAELFQHLALPFQLQRRGTDDE